MQLFQEKLKDDYFKNVRASLALFEKKLGDKLWFAGDKVCNVNGHTDLTNMIRQYMPIVLILLLRFLGQPVNASIIPMQYFFLYVLFFFSF